VFQSSVKAIGGPPLPSTIQGLTLTPHLMRQPGAVGTFSALVFSSGGLVEKETANVLDGWRLVVSGVAWEWMVRRISIGLVRSRARTWEVQRTDCLACNRHKTYIA
jgi:hypothetical protein